MKRSLKPMSPWIGMLMALGLAACYPTAQHKNPERIPSDFVVKGTLVAQGRSVDMVSLYLEQEQEPDAYTQNDGSFQLFFTAPRVSALSSLYELKDRPLHVYFEDENNLTLIPAGAMLEIPSITQSGVLDLGEIPLLPLTTLSGSGRGTKGPETSTVPVAGVDIKVGRRTATSDRDGLFQVAAPQNAVLPVSLSANGYVETIGLWPTDRGPDDKSWPMLETLAVDGQLQIPNSFRQLDPNDRTLDLMVIASPLVRYVRIAADASLLTSSDTGAAPWQSIQRRIQLPVFGAQANFVYQFADAERKVLSRVYTLTVAGSVPLDNGTLTNPTEAQ